MNLHPPKLIVDSVSKYFKRKNHNVLAINNISLNVDENEFVCILGPSGCGKSTLLNLIAGLEMPDKGSVFINEQPVVAPGQQCMVVFQESALFPWLNVLQNVLFGLHLFPDMSAHQKHEIANFYLRLVGLEKFMHANVHELSGGMKQRTALARALAPKPQLLLMDEPFGSLDTLTREQLYFDMQHIWQAQSKTIIFVTHNVAEAVCLGDRVLVFSAQPGQIVEEFKINLSRPRDIRDSEVAKIAEQISQAFRLYSSHKAL